MGRMRKKIFKNKILKILLNQRNRVIANDFHFYGLSKSPYKCEGRHELFIRTGVEVSGLRHSCASKKVSMAKTTNNFHSNLKGCFRKDN